MKKILLSSVMIILILMLAAGCSLLPSFEPFSEEDFVNLLEEAVLQRQTELTYRCAEEENIRARVEAALNKTYEKYIFGANIDNVSWVSSRDFAGNVIKLTLEYKGEFTDSRQDAWEYSAEELTRRLQEAVIAEKPQIKTLLINNGTITDKQLSAEFDKILFGGKNAVMSYYLKSAQYSVITYEDYIGITMMLEYADDMIVPFAELAKPADVAQAIDMTLEQWEERSKAVLYLSEAPENIESYCHKIVTTATAMDADSAYLCDSYQWNAFGTGDTIVTLERSCDYDPDDLKNKEKELIAAAEEIAAGITATDRKEAVKEIAKVLCDRIVYDGITANEILAADEYSDEVNIARTAYGALISGRTVCTGYAKAFQLICDIKGIECWTIDGTVDGTGHEWNVVYIDGEMYYVDVTFADTGKQKKYYLFDETVYAKEGYIPDENFYIPAA